jgi:hypothetical protein
MTEWIVRRKRVSFSGKPIVDFYVQDGGWTQEKRHAWRFTVLAEAKATKWKTLSRTTAEDSVAVLKLVPPKRSYAKLARDVKILRDAASAAASWLREIALLIEDLHGPGHLGVTMRKPISQLRECAKALDYDSDSHRCEASS